MEKFKVVNLIGPPGSGKSTLADLVIARKGFGYLGTGNIIKECTPGYGSDTDKARRYRAEYSDLLLPYLAAVTQAMLIPDDVMIPILLKELKYEASKQSPGIVLAGSIKNSNQGESLSKGLMNITYNRFIQQIVIRLDASDDILLRRLKERSARRTRPDDAIILQMLMNYRKGESELNNYYSMQRLLTNILTDEMDIESAYQVLEAYINK